MSRRIFHFVLITGLGTGPLRAQTDPFVGRWRLVKLTDQMTLTKVGANEYAFDFGGGVETIVADGTDQPAAGGTRRKGGRTLSSTPSP